MLLFGAEGDCTKQTFVRLEDFVQRLPSLLPAFVELLQPIGLDLLLRAQPLVVSLRRLFIRARRHEA